MNTYTRRSDLICSTCGAEKEFLGGEPAHETNLYCPVCDRIAELERQLKEGEE